MLCASFAHAFVDVQVRGSSQIIASLDPSTARDELTFKGLLLDDQGRPLAYSSLTLLASTSGQKAVILSPLGDCTSSVVETQDEAARVTPDAAPQRGTTGQRARTVSTDANGAFCVRISVNDLPVDTRVKAEFAGTGLLDGTQVELQAADLRESLVGSFADIESVVSLDAANVSLTVRVVRIGDSTRLPPRIMAERDGSTVADSALPCELRLLEGTQETVLRRQTIRLGELMTMRLARADLGSPGPAELVLVFDGNDDFRPLRLARRIVRTLQVQIVPLALPKQAVSGERLALAFTTASELGPVDSGAVELVLDGGHTRVAPLTRSGRAEFVVATPQNQSSLLLLARYLPNREGYRAAAPDEIRLTIAPPSPWRYAVWLVPALLVVGWLGFAGRPPLRTALRAHPRRPMPPRAHVEIMPSNSQLGGWSGFLVDAHEGTPLARARILAKERGFGESPPLFQTVSDDRGVFVLPPELANRLHVELVIAADRYMEFRTELPSSSPFRIHLVSIRRDLLDRLVEWTKRRGGPYRSTTEPTPQWVARVAALRGHKSIERWAKRLGDAAFRQEPPGAPLDKSLLSPTGPTADDTAPRAES